MLPWENNTNASLIGIATDSSILNRLMEIDAMQNVLPDKMMYMKVKELDETNIGYDTCK